MIDAETKEYVDSKVDKVYALLKGLNHKFDDKFNGLSQKFDDKFDSLRAEMSGLDKKMDAVLSVVGIFSEAYKDSQKLYHHILEDLRYLKKRVSRKEIGFESKNTNSK